MKWLKEHEDLLLSEFKSGSSASETANALNKAFGCSLTRSAIASAWRRMKLDKTKRPTKEVERKTIEKPKLIVRKKVTPPRPVPERFFTREASSEMNDLNKDTCRWPFGNRPPYRYCGAKTFQGPYCRVHAQISYVKPERRFR